MYCLFCFSDSLEIAEKSLALAILHIQRCNRKQAQEILENINMQHLKQLLQENCDLLFDCTQKTKIVSFSELTIQLFANHSDLLAELFVTQTKVVSLNKILKAFLDYLPASIGNDCNVASGVLQNTLELYFCKLFDKTDLSQMTFDRSTNEAMKILVRSYLSQLQILQMKEKQNGNVEGIERKVEMESDVDDKDSQQEKIKYNQTTKYFEEGGVKYKKEIYLLSKHRFEYLDKMPPFQVEITTKLYESCLANCTTNKQYKTNEEADFVLKKLQALLCSQLLPKQVITEVNAFLNLNEDLRGHASLRSITMNVHDAVTFLIDSCPQCLLQYGKVH